MLLAATMGDCVYVTRPPCKNDPKGTKFGRVPVPSRYHPTHPINFAREIIRYELMRRVAPEARARAPAVLAPGGAPWTKTSLRGLFKALCLLVMTEHRAGQVSIHSFRVWLACALRALGASVEQIMALLGWSSEAAKELYARINVEEAGAVLERVVDASFTSVLSHTLLSSSPPTALTQEQTRQHDAGLRLLRDEQLLSGAMDCAAAAADPGCAIDDDDTLFRVRSALPRLRDIARASDEHLLGADGVYTDGEESDDDP